MLHITHTCVVYRYIIWIHKYGHYAKYICVCICVGGGSRKSCDFLLAVNTPNFQFPMKINSPFNTPNLTKKTILREFANIGFC